MKKILQGFLRLWCMATLSQRETVWKKCQEESFLIPVRQKVPWMQSGRPENQALLFYA